MASALAGCQVRILELNSRKEATGAAKHCSWGTQALLLQDKGGKLSLFSSPGLGQEGLLTVWYVVGVDV